MTIDHDTIAALDEKLASQIGDDIQVIFNHEYLFKEARLTIRNLYDDVKRLRADLRHVIDERDATFALMLARAEKAEAERDALRAALVDLASDRIRALPVAEPAPVVVRIKKLVWVDADEGMCTKWRAAALGGHYELVILDKEDGLFSVNFRWGNPLGFWFIQGEPDQFGPTGPKKFPSIEAAQAAAEADLAARVLNQIDAVSVAQVRAEALEEAAKLPPYDGDGDPAGPFDHHVFVKRAAIRALIEKEPNE